MLSCRYLWSSEFSQCFDARATNNLDNTFWLSFGLYIQTEIMGKQDILRKYWQFSSNAWLSSDSRNITNWQRSSVLISKSSPQIVRGTLQVIFWWHGYFINRTWVCDPFRVNFDKLDLPVTEFDKLAELSHDTCAKAKHNSSHAYRISKIFWGRFQNPRWRAVTHGTQ